MKTYEKPKVLADSTKQMSHCITTYRPMGRPCNPPNPQGR